MWFKKDSTQLFLFLTLHISQSRCVWYETCEVHTDTSRLSNETCLDFPKSKRELPPLIEYHTIHSD
jgi:hypothetical protein